VRNAGKAGSQTVRDRIGGVQIDEHAHDDKVA